ncbi:MAG: thioredoxin family protein [bacterium]|nr:thioredoxin family protein [bacterium]
MHARPGRLLILVCICLGMYSCSRNESTPPVAQHPPAAEVVKPEPDFTIWYPYTDGLALAAEYDRPVVINFYNAWNPWCKVMATGVFAADSVRARLDERFVRIQVDVESGAQQGQAVDAPSGRDLADTYAVTECPHVWFLNAAGRRITHLVGQVEPQLFGEALDYISTGGYHEQPFKAYSDSLRALRI